MTAVGSPADSTRRKNVQRTGILRQAWINRADYLYVLPSIGVMLVVIAYPIYYTIELSFFNTPPSLQLRDKIFVGLDNYGLIV